VNRSPCPALGKGLGKGRTSGSGRVLMHLDAPCVAAWTNRIGRTASAFAVASHGLCTLPPPAIGGRPVPAAAAPAAGAPDTDTPRRLR
jgi:hypothetical protein